MTTNTALNKDSDFEILLVRPTGDEELWQQCLTVRLEVFAVEQGFPEDTEIDDYDKTAFQFLLRSLPDHVPKGVIRFNPPPDSNRNKGIKLARLAVVKDYRGKGHADRLVKAVHGWAISTPEAQTANGDAVIWLHAQLPVIKFYSRFGYLSVGPQFDEEGAPHQKMEVHLARAE